MIKDYNSSSWRTSSQLRSGESLSVGNVPNTEGKTRTNWLMIMLLVVTFMFNLDLWSQTSAYSFTSTTSTFSPLSGGTVVNTTAGLSTSMSTNADDGAILITLPFSFTYNGTVYTQATMCTNGWVGMGNQLTVTAAQGRTGGNLFTNTAPNNLIAPWFADGTANFPSPNPGSMRYGSGGTGIYVFEWNQVSGNGFTANTTILITYQVRIYGPTSATPGRIEMCYGPRSGTISTGRAVGIAGINTDYFNATTGNSTATTTASAFPALNTMYVFTPPNPCTGTPSPGNTLSSLSPVCSGVNFTLSLQNATPGTGVTYQWQSADDLAFTSNVVNLGTAATQVTSQTATKFYRCNVTCSGNTGTSTPLQLTLNNFLNCYNTISATNTADEEISNVTVGTLNNSSTCLTTAPGAGSILTRYSNYRGFVTAPDLSRGTSSSFSLTQTSCGGSFGNGFQVYIDFNQNGNFEDSERVYNQPVATTGNHTEIGSLPIPIGALLGNTGMRVVVVETTFPTTTNYANTSYSWGETEDYIVNIVEAPSCVEPSALTSSAVTNNSATISWTASITPPANGYDYIVSTSSTPPTGSSTPTGNTASLSVNLTSLPGNTQHFYWVRSNCSGVEQSAWAGAGTFTTLLVVPTPYNEGFATAVQPAGWSNSGFTYGALANLTPVTSVVYKNLWASATTGNFTTVNIGPVLANQELSYDFRLVNFSDTNTPAAGSGNFVVAISTDFGATYSTLETVANDGIGGWRTKTYSLASYVGQNIRLRVTGTWTSGDYYLGFDNFKVATVCSGTPVAGTVAPVSQSVCPGLPVLPFVASGFTTDAGITFQWEQSVNAGPWVNAVGGSGATTSTYTPPVYTGGVIKYRLRVLCTNSALDAISTESEINSSGNPLPLIQPFTNLNTFGGWTVTGGYSIAAAPLRGATGNPGGYAISNLWTSNPANGLTTAKYGPVQAGQAVSFDLKLTNFGTPFAPPAAGWGSLDVQISTDCGANFTSVGTITDTPTASYKNYKYYLGAYVGQDVVVRISGTWLAGDYDVAIDNLNIDFTAPVVQSFTPTSACSVGGDVITVTGFGFTGATATIGTTPVTVNVTSDTSMTITTPSGLATGQYINVTNGIGTGSSLTTLTVNPTPVMPPIVGANEMCLSTPTLSLTNTQGNGVWTSSNEAVATINSISGDVTGLTEGNTLITYTYTENGCSASVTHSLDVRQQVAITSQPSPVVVVTGNNSSFSVTATGTGLTYAWEVSTDNGATWSPLSDDALYSGTASSTLTITATPSGLNGNEYHCIVTGTSPCSPETSSSATLAVGNTGIDTHPSNVSLCNGGTATFTVVASGDIVGYQWYEDQGFGPAPITDGGDYSGATTATLTINNTNTSFNGYTYYVIVDGPANDPQSNVATLFVAEGPSVDQQPLSTTVCRVAGSASFTVTTLGTVSGIQWQSAPAAGGPWTNAGTGGTLNIGITGTTPVGTTYYKAILNGNAPCTAVESDVVTLTVQQPTIVVTPSAATYCAPGSAVTLTASGASSYVWSPATGLNTTTGATVSATPSVTTVYTVTGTDALGCINTTTVTVTAANATTASATASLAEACPGENIQLNGFGTQAFTPGTIGSYAFTNSTSTFASIVGAPGTTAVTISSMDDGISATLTLPFTFNYAGTNFTQYRINSNGWVGFGAPTSTTNYNALNGTVNNVIAVFNRDLNGNNTTATSYYVQTTGTAPNRITKIEWVNVRSWDALINPQTANFQLWLYEGSNAVEMRYGAFTTAAARTSTGSVQVGLRGVSTAATNVRSLSNVGAWSNPTIGTSSTATVALGNFAAPLLPDNGRVYRFAPGNTPSFTYAWSSSPAGFTSAVANPTVNPTVTTTYTVQVTGNSGCVGTAQVTVNVVSDANITTEPVAVSQCAGTNATFSVVATGPSLTYQWRKDGTNILGANAATYSITGIAAADAGSYDVVVTPLCGSTDTSVAVSLTVNAIPTATASNNGPVCEGSTLNLTGTTDIGATYAWSGPAGFTSGALSPSISNVTVANAGTYNLTVTSAAGCSFTTSTVVVILPNPTIAINPANDPLNACIGEIKTLSVATTSTGTNVILSENFNGATNGWIRSNATTGTNGALAAWTLRPSPYTRGVTFTSNDASQFYLSDSDAAGSGSAVNAKLQSPSFSTVGYTAANVSYYHYYQHLVATQNVEYSIDGGTTWVSFRTYSATQGTTTAFALDTVALPAAALGQANVSIRFNYVDGWAWRWAIDNFKVEGTLAAPSFAWSPTTNLYSDANATIPYTGGDASTVYAKVTGAAAYTATSTNLLGCTRTDVVNFNITTSGCPSTTVLQPSQCGVTLPAINSYIYANLVSNAQGYRFRVTDMTTNQVQIADRALRVFHLTQLPSYAFNRTYQVEVAVRLNNVWQPFYGAPCTVTTPIPTTLVQSAQCGSTLTTMNDVIYANLVPFAAGYKFRITNLLTSEQLEFERPIRDIRLTNLPSPQFNTTYSIEVAVKNTNGEYFAYGTPCNVTSPSFPTTQVQTSQCDLSTSLPLTTTLFADSFTGATTYRFRFINGATTIQVDRPIRSIYLASVPGIQAGTAYSVSVALEINGTFGPFGKVCLVTTAGGARETEVVKPVSPFNAMAYPNPFAENFKLNVTTSVEESIQVKVYDMLGKLVENRTVDTSVINEVEIGTNYPAGVYNVIVSQGSEVKTLRVIKR